MSPYSYDCLTRSRWDALLEFAASTGLKIAFGLNGCYGRPGKNASMDYTNAEALFAATAASPHVAGFCRAPVGESPLGGACCPYPPPFRAAPVRPPAGWDSGSV